MRNIMNLKLLLTFSILASMLAGAMIPALKFPDKIWQISQQQEDPVINSIDFVLRGSAVNNYISLLPAEVRKELALLYTLNADDHTALSVQHLKYLLEKQVFEKDSEDKHLNKIFIKQLEKRSANLDAVAFADLINSDGAQEWKNKNEFHLRLNQIINNTDQPFTLEITGIGKIFKPVIIGPGQIQTIKKKLGYLKSKSVRLLLTCPWEKHSINPYIGSGMQYKGSLHLVFNHAKYNKTDKGYTKIILPASGAGFAWIHNLMLQNTLNVVITSDHSIAFQLERGLQEDLASSFKAIQFI